MLLKYLGRAASPNGEVILGFTSDALPAPIERQRSIVGDEMDEIVVTARREGSVTIIEVADSGPGVHERARTHLFEAFQSVARKGGSGLGLAIAQELVQAHGGQIALVKNEGGATFRVTIPDVVVKLERARRRRA